MLPGEFDAHDEQVTAMVFTAQPFNLPRVADDGPQVDYMQPITCACTKYREQPYHGPERRPPCVEQADESGYCPACSKGLCTTTAVEGESAA